MKKMLENRGLQVLAFVLCLVFALGAVGCGLGYVYDAEEETMRGERNFFDSELARYYVNRSVWNALHFVYYEQRQGQNDGRSAAPTPPLEEAATADPTPLPEEMGAAAPASLPENEAFADPMPTPMPTLMPTAAATSGDAYPVASFSLNDEGFACVIYDPEGEIVADFRTDTSYPVSDRDSYWELNGYTAKCYVNLPAARGTALYNVVALYDFLYNGRNAFLPLAIVFAALALAMFVFLMAAAGRTPEGTALRGVHRWPLEICAGLLIGGILAFGYAFLRLGDSLFQFRMTGAVITGMAGCLLAAGAAALLLCVSLAARFRAGQWWRNTIVFFLLRLAWRLLRWFARGLRNVVRAVPVAWKAGLAFAAVALTNVLGMTIAFESWNGGFWLFALFVLDLAGLAGSFLLGAQLKKLREAARALAAGDLAYTVDTSRMWWDLKAHGEDLNAVGMGMARAVNERMRSERFKTELITNVSHDLKTPLTSIVSYVDLLKKEDVPGEKAREYIEVLDRQSQRLRKLTCDLVEASKASSGVMPVHLEQVDLKELLSQSLGEYAGRFAAAGVEPVLSLPEGETVVRADGRLLWRVLDNLLLNVTKYAMGGTRFYLDLTREPGGLALTLKNISRESLNIPAEELMERFVRGDASRHTEGSGLGLSIARSLMELMGGRLELTLDGDLFKVILRFPSG